MSLKHFHRIFKGFFILFLVTLSAWALIRLLQGVHPLTSSAGLLLAASTPLVFLILRRWSARKFKDLEPLGFIALCGLGMVITMATSWMHGSVAGQVHVWAGACLLLWFLYARWYLRK